MAQTLFSDKVRILGDFYARACEDDYMRSTPLMQDHDQTLWICLASNVKYVTIHERFSWAVDEAWSAFCDYLGVDSYGQYASLDDILDFADAE